MGVFAGTLSSSKTEQPPRGLWHYLKRLGVSVLFAGAAVGVSHVVQATRAGAEFSLLLLPVVLLCLVLKYPAFLFGPLYTSVTNESVVRGYARVGRWSLPLVGVSFAVIMATVVAAVALLAAGILVSTLGLAVSPVWIAVTLAAGCTCVSLYASFERFQNSIKIVFVLLVGLSLVALMAALPSTNTATFEFNVSSLSQKDLFFLAALVGWMPAGLDLPMMHSQWILARRQAGQASDNTIEDFNFGYLSTAVLAIIFLLIGAVFFYGAGIEVATSAGGFAAQLTGAYQTALGSPAGLVMGVTLFLAIFSSLIVVIDGFPRVLSEVMATYRHGGDVDMARQANRYRNVSAWLQFAGAAIVLLSFASSLTALVDFATITSFVLGPVFALLNHRLIGLPHFTEQRSVNASLRLWSLIGIAFFTLFTAYYAYLRLV